MRRLRKWLIRAAAAWLVVVGAGVAFEQWSRWRAPHDFPPPGRLVEVRGTPLHLHCAGSGAPTVVLEAGTGSPSLVWAAVQPRIAGFTRVCSYDRAGLGWSGGRGGSGGAVAAADDLRALLAAAGERGPFVLVGHSMGGPRSLVFTHRFPAEVAGLVFVDATVAEAGAAAPAGGDEGMGTRLRRQAVFAALTETGTMRIVQSLLADPGQGEERRRSRAFGPQGLRAAMRDGAGSPEVLEAARGTGSLGGRPTVALTAWPPQLPDEMSPEVQARVAEVRRGSHAALAARSTDGDHRLVGGTGHVIQNDAPDAVVAAVRDVTLAVRGGSALRGAGSRATAVAVRPSSSSPEAPAP